jgi:hypothetical protein
VRLVPRQPGQNGRITPAAVSAHDLHP